MKPFLLAFLLRMFSNFYWGGNDFVFTKHILEFCGDISNKIIGDIGCGYGIFSLRLAKKAKFVYGGDIRKNVIKKIKKFEQENLKFLHLDAQKLPFPNEFFDILIFRDSLEHIPNDKKTLKESWRVLKKNGILIITVPNKDFPQYYNFPISKLISKTALKKYHLFANNFENCFQNFNEEMGHFHTYNKEFFSNLDGFKLVAYKNLINRIGMYYTELTAFEQNFKLESLKWFFPFKIFSHLFSFPVFLINEKTENNEEGLEILVKLKKW